MQAGLRHLLATGLQPDALLVCPADLPDLAPATVAALLAARRQAAAELLVPTHGGRRGHPLVVAPRLLPEIFTLDRAIGLRELLARHPVAELPVADERAVRDVDTPADYQSRDSRAQ